MALPAPLQARLVAALDGLALGHVRSLHATAGGCISETARVRTSAGTDLFLKWSGGEQHPGMFTAEMRSLEALAATNTLRVPRVLAVEDSIDDHDAPRFLLLEWLEPGPARELSWERLGTGLASLHRAPSRDRFGADHDNFIGTLRQSNRSTADWPEFWRERRIRPQLELAFANGWFDSGEVRRFDALLAALDDILSPAAGDGPSLLHGDLWSGNLHVLASGEPALIDPSSYVGHREVDLAMTHLFGGFDDAFLRAYGEAWPLEAGYERARRPVYQLYYLLVHANLFGGSYRAATLGALRGAGF
ncbi:MAG TPA: fructosamine kinase family protein [Thermoanaerobaculia bacterium]